MSLRLRLTLGLVLVNAVVLGAVAFWGAQRLREAARPQEERANALQVEMARLVQARFRPEDVGNLARMLEWPLWSEFEDALIVESRVLPNLGLPVPVGVFLNPRGSRRRPADFPLPEITRAVVRAAEEDRSIPVAGGVAMPIRVRPAFADRAQPWGGVFVRLVPPVEAPSFALRILGFGLAATVLGAALIFFLVDRTVLRPVLALQHAAAEFGAGGAPALRADRGTAREVQALTRSLEEMMREIRGFQQELQARVDAAAERALLAERHASRQDRLAALGMLAAGLAHEINSPLAGALHSLEVLRRESASAKGERYGQLAEEALQRIRGLVQRLLLMAPQEAAGGSCTLREVAEDLRALLASRLDRHRLELDLPEPGPVVAGARGDWLPLLLNLTQNALDALDAAPDARTGTVRLAARELAGGGAEVTVADDGPGAPPELLPRLFEPFTTTKEPGRGTGLGLALAHATVRSLGGAIEASNLPGGGFEVRIRVPAPAAAPA